MTPLEFTQLAGRAGRRGLDDIGNVIIYWPKNTKIISLSKIIKSDSYYITSQFKTKYNTAANLLEIYDVEQLELLVSKSLHQLQVDDKSNTSSQSRSRSGRHKGSNTVTSLRGDYTKVVSVLEELEYVKNGKLTQKGSTLKNLHIDVDLHLAQIVNSGMLKEAGAKNTALVIMWTMCESRSYEDIDIDQILADNPYLSLATIIFEETQEVENRYRGHSASLPSFGWIDRAEKWLDSDDDTALYCDVDIHLWLGDFLKLAKRSSEIMNILGSEVPELVPFAREAKKLMLKNVVAELLDL